MSAPTKVVPLKAPRVTSWGMAKIFSSITSSRHTCETRRRGAVGSTSFFDDFANLQSSLVDGALELEHERTSLQRRAIELLLHPAEEVEQLRRPHRALEAHRPEVKGTRLLRPRRGRRGRGRTRGGLLFLLRLRAARRGP